MGISPVPLSVMTTGLELNKRVGQNWFWGTNAELAGLKYFTNSSWFGGKQTSGRVRKRLQDVLYLLF